jgi:hypothetical protein
MKGRKKQNISNLKNKVTNQPRVALKNYPHIILKGESDDVAELIKFID